MVIPFKLNPSRHISKAEKSIFEKALKCNILLSSDNFFFHSLRIDEAGNKLVGEVDFVYLDNEFILFLEVKGGTVYYNSDKDEWRTQDGKSNKDPFHQVCSSLFDVRDKKFPDVFRYKNYEKRLIFGYGVLFPDCNLPLEFSNNYNKSHKYYTHDNIEYNLKLIYTNEQHQNDNGLDNYLNKLKEYWRSYPKYKNRTNKLNKDELSEIKNYFRRDLIFETPILDLLNNDYKKTLFYTKQQEEILDIINLNLGHGFIVSGGPGTGKTLLALEQAKQNCEKGNKVLFLCFNKALSDFISDKLSKFNCDDNSKGCIEVNNFHGLILSIIKNNQLDLSIDDNNDFWQRRLPMFFKNSFSNFVNKQEYDFLVIDEGQDIFTDLYMECLNLLLSGGLDSGNYTIYLDKYYQSVYNTFNLDYYELFKKSYNSIEYPLNKNCRNTPNIINKAYYDTGMPKIDCLKTDLFPPEMVFYSSINEMLVILGKKVHNLLSKNVPKNNITVLTTRALVDEIIQTNSKLYCELHINNSNNKITVTTPHSFKGLENQIIIFTGYDKYDPYNKLLMSNYYVAYTRAISHLIIMLDKSVKDNLTKSIQKRILEETLKQ